MSAALYRHLLKPLDPDEGIPEASVRSQSFIGIQRGQKLTMPSNERGRVSLAVYPCVGGGAVMHGILLALGHILSCSHQIELLPTPLHEDEAGELVEGDFTPADWGLDVEEDFSLSGEYRVTDGKHTLTIQLETSTDDLFTWTLDSPDQGGLWEKALALADTLADHIDAEFDVRPFDDMNGFAWPVSAPIFEAVYRDHAEWMRNPKQAETWSIERFGQYPPEGAWLVAGMAAFRVLLCLRLKTDEAATELPSPLLGEAYGVFALLTSWNQPELTAQMLEKTESVVAAGVSSEDNYTALARLYEYLSRPDLGAEVCQTALKAEHEGAQILFAYADTLGLAADAGIQVEPLLWEEDVLSEYAEALRRAVELRPIATRLAELCADAAGQEMFDDALDYLTMLIEVDTRFIRVEGLLDELSHLEDLSWFVQALHSATRAGQGGFRAFLIYAKALRLDGDIMRAQAAVERALKIAQDVKEQGEAQSLALSLDTPTFEAEMADLINRLQQESAEFFERDLEFLEYVVEQAPQHPEGYLALSAVYNRMGEAAAALEVLLDAESKAYIVPDVYLSLSELLAGAEQWDLALENIRKGLDLAPNNVSLMAQAAILSHRLGDSDGAVSFLRRAHRIRPYHPRVMMAAKLIDADTRDS